MRILVTGGFGYLGSGIAQSLNNLGHSVILGSRKNRKKPDWLSQAEVVQMDWNDENSLKIICKGVDVIIHAAGMNAEDCFNNPSAAFDSNGTQTARLVNSSQKSKVKKFIFLSTVHVYSSILSGEINEDNYPKNIHPYAQSNLVGENSVLKKLDKSNNFVGIVLRLSNVIGAPIFKDSEGWSLVVNNLCLQAVKNKKITLNTDGQQARDFISFTHLKKIINRCCEENIDSDVYNVGSGSSISILSMANRVKKLCSEMYSFSPSLIVGRKSQNKNNNFIYSTARKVNFFMDSSSEINNEIRKILHYLA